VTPAPLTCSLPTMAPRSSAPDEIVADYFALRGEPVAVCLTPGELAALLVRAVKASGSSATHCGAELAEVVCSARGLLSERETWGGVLCQFRRLELAAVAREAVRWALEVGPPELRHEPQWPDDGDELGAAALGAALEGACACEEAECPCACHRVTAERLKEAIG
jgi:hypothetical protein